MKLLFSGKNVEFDGTIVLPGVPSEDIQGLVQVRGLMVESDLGAKAFVENAGTIVVTHVRGLQGYGTGEIAKILDLDMGKAVGIQSVSGVVVVDISGRATRQAFKGVFHPTGYLKRAILALESPGPDNELLLF